MGDYKCAAVVFFGGGQVGQGHLMGLGSSGHVISGEVVHLRQLASHVERRWPPRQVDGGEGVGCTRAARILKIFKS